MLLFGKCHIPFSADRSNALRGWGKTDSNACFAEKSFRVKGKETQKVRGVTHSAENCQKTDPIQCKVRKRQCIQPLGSGLQSNLLSLFNKSKQ